MRYILLNIKVSFNINNLVSTRSFLFSITSYGKSNLIKFLLSELYHEGIPKTDRGENVSVLIFDIDGEYFWTDFKDSPGLCYVRQFQEHIIFFKLRQQKSKYYNTWNAGDIRIDMRQLLARYVIGICISEDIKNK
ncbi:MAG: helicase HerA domain-containing protein [Flavobacteriales bacterium AspAUS03]